jgi:hypothetical protein
MRSAARTSEESDPEPVAIEPLPQLPAPEPYPVNLANHEQLAQSIATALVGVNARPVPEQGTGQDHIASTTKPDGTIDYGHIWLRGHRYRLTPGLRQLLHYLLEHQGAPEDDVIHHFGISSAPHLHKRLKDLRDKLTQELSQSGWQLHIKTQDTCVYW